MFILDCNIKIGDYTFKQVHNVNIVHSVDLLSDTATIKLPVNALFGNENKSFEKKRLEDVIKAGDKVEITLAYKDVFQKKEFSGYVAFVKPNSPIVEIECEDAVYKIRQKRINKNFGKTTLKQVFNFILENTEVKLSGNIPEVNFDKFLLKNVNGAKALQKIKEEYGLNIYMDDNEHLFAGLRQVKEPGEKPAYNLHKNVITQDLKYRNADDIKLYVKVIGVQKDNTKTEITVGDPNGEQRTLHKYNISDKKLLEEIGKAELSDLKFTGYEGSISSFFIPYATRGMSAEITDSNFPDRSGTYFIPKVNVKFGQNGARRIVELGNKLS